MTINSSVIRLVMVNDAQEWMCLKFKAILKNKQHPSVYWLQSDDDALLLIIDTDTTLRCGITCTSWLATPSTAATLWSELRTTWWVLTNQKPVLSEAFMINIDQSGESWGEGADKSRDRGLGPPQRGDCPLPSWPGEEFDWQARAQALAQVPG